MYKTDKYNGWFNFPDLESAVAKVRANLNTLVIEQDAQIGITSSLDNKVSYYCDLSTGQATIEKLDPTNTFVMVSPSGNYATVCSPYDANFSKDVNLATVMSGIVRGQPLYNVLINEYKCKEVPAVEIKKVVLL